MFYCEDCRKDKNWPSSMVMSYGKCEICEKSNLECHDRPSSSLSPEEPETVVWEGTVDGNDTTAVTIGSEQAGYVHVVPGSEIDFVYIHLWHGRDERTQDMDVTGYDGPIIGPFISIQIQYAYGVRCLLDEEGNDFWLYFDEDPHSLCVYYDGKWYGSLCILPARNMVKDGYYQKMVHCKPDQSKAKHPKSAGGVKYSDLPELPPQTEDHTDET